MSRIRAAQHAFVKARQWPCVSATKSCEAAAYHNCTTSECLKMDEIVDLLGRYEGINNAVIVSPGILLVYQPAQDMLQCQAIPLR